MQNFGRTEGYINIEVRPMTGVIGAEILGIDLHNPTEAAVAEVRRALGENLVVTFPGQVIDHAEHIRFSNMLGDHVRMPQVKSLEGYEDLQMIKRDPDSTGKVIGEAWHADSTWMECPPAAVAMRAIDIPEYGGDTGFTSMYAAYDSLSPTMKELLGNLRAVHSGTKTYGSQYKSGEGKRFDKNFNSMDEKMVDKERAHPVVCVHPTSGRKYLFVNRSFVQRFEGMTDEESKPILEFLYSHASRFEYTCRIRWKKDLLLIWDNRASMHTAISDYPGKARYMLRTTLVGQQPSAT